MGDFNAQEWRRRNKKARSYLGLMRILFDAANGEWDWERHPQRFAQLLDDYQFSQPLSSEGHETPITLCKPQEPSDSRPIDILDAIAEQIKQHPEQIPQDPEGRDELLDRIVPNLDRLLSAYDPADYAPLFRLD